VALGQTCQRSFVLLLFYRAMQGFLLLVTGCTLAALAGRAQSLHTTEPLGGATGASPTVLNYAEQMPAFPGGEVALHHYLAAQTKYPAEALRRGVSGQVVVQFVVDEQGRVLEPQVVKSTDGDFNAEALRLVWLMPWWTPGRQQQQAVRVRCTLPISFTFKR
jgi:protein TonB